MRMISITECELSNTIADFFSMSCIQHWRSKHDKAIATMSLTEQQQFINDIDYQFVSLGQPPIVVAGYIANILYGPKL